MSDSPSDPPGDPATEDLWIDRYLMPAIRDSTLFPLLLVVIGHAVAFMAPALLFAVRDRSIFGMAALIALAFGTVQCIRFEVGRRRSPYPLSAIVISTWLASGAAAWACDHYRLL